MFVLLCVFQAVGTCICVMVVVVVVVYTYIYIDAAEAKLVSVGLAQARPNNIYSVSYKILG